jgi:hypothetical protein
MIDPTKAGQTNTGLFIIKQMMNHIEESKCAKMMALRINKKEINIYTLA